MNVALYVILSIQELGVGDNSFLEGAAIEARFSLRWTGYQVILGPLTRLDRLLQGVQAFSVDVSYLILRASLHHYIQIF